MYSLKSSFANCSVCPLLDAPSCILETNCKKDLSKVDVVFIAENPGKDEIKKGAPLVGKAGLMFRKYFKKYNIDKMNYLLTNCVLCQTLNEDGTTGNPTPEVIDICKTNCINIVKSCNPKLVVVMGASPMSALGIAKAGITNMHGKVTEWNGYKTIVIVHPSFVNRQMKVWEPKFEEALSQIAAMLGGKKQITVDSHIKSMGKGIYRYKIPDKFYTDEYRLVDIHFLNQTQQILYIFRDKDNKKIYHKKDDNYICYQVPKGMPAKKILPYDDLDQVMIKYRDRYDLDPEITYEGDVRLTVKHAMDYYHFNQGESKRDFSNIMFFDIEVDTGDQRIFPTPKEAKFPINMLTTIFNGITECYVVDNKTEKLKCKEDVTYHIFDNEKEMMRSFINNLKGHNPDFIAGWNCVGEDEYVYLKDRIIKIKNVNEKDVLKDSNVILKHKKTGKKEAYKINLKSGVSINSSLDHIFPYYKKPKKEYYTPEKLLLNRYEDKLKNIIDVNKVDDVYLKMDFTKNKNSVYTWGEYIKENIDILLQLDFVDIKIIDRTLQNKIKQTGIHKEKLHRSEYWQGSMFFKHSFWSYKNFKNIITKEDILQQLSKYDEQVFKIGKNYNLNVKMNEPISNGHLQLLGFMYTDGFWSNYAKGHCFDNKDYNTIYNYNNIMNEFRRFPYEDISHKWNKRDSLYTLGFGMTNLFTLLIPFVYNCKNKLKKKLNIESLSRLSEEQFIHFFSGLVDGDGSTSKNEIKVCCYEDYGNDCKKINTLLTWNGVFSYLRDNSIMIPRINFNFHFLKKMTTFHSSRSKFCNTKKLREVKNSCSRWLNKFFYDDFILIKISEILSLGIEIDMCDIETTNHYFLCNGIDTHNCISFDLEYIYTRLPQIGIKQNSFSQFGEFYIDGSKYIAHIPGIVAIDQDFLYKTFTFTKMENYKLGFIAEHELDGYTKLDLPLPFNEMYWKMFNLTVDYNIRDTELLEKLDNKLDHINLLNELRIICNTSFDSVSSFGQTDSLMVSYLRNKGISSKNADPHIKKQKYPGAYVHEPVPGVYDWITDFDFASLYPSIMITYNIGVNSYVMKLEDPYLGYELTYRPELLPKQIKVIIDPLYEKKEITITPEQLLSKIQDNNLVFTINGCFFQPHDKEFSVFGEVVDMLMTSRNKYKGQMFDAIETKETDKEKYFYTRQLVYKVLANTLYGVVANKAFRFFDVSLAAAITLSGQEAIKTSIIEGDAFMRHLNTDQSYVTPNPLTKKEMYGDKMPDRGNEYIITGDTDSIFCCFQEFKDTSVEAIHNNCNKIEDFLNDDKMVKVVKKHNGELKYNRLKLKNELVISRGLFLAKKRYAIRVINNEGKTVDKVNYMGVEIKRSDYPRESKVFLSELLDLILKSEKFHFGKIFEFVSRREREFRGLISKGEKSIARPVTWGKNLKDYKLVPQAVKSMIAWNEIMYNIHNKGAKGYMFWIKGIDFDKIPDVKERENIHKNYSKFIGKGNKLEVIGMPDEESKLPPWFIPDMKASLNFSFIDRYELMLKPLTEVKKKTELLTI